MLKTQSEAIVGLKHFRFIILSLKRKCASTVAQPRSQGLSSLPPLRWNRDEFIVSKETVVLRRWERSKQKFGFIKRVDKG